MLGACRGGSSQGVEIGGYDMRVKLSQAVLANAKPAATRYLVRDTRTVGLALKVEPSGTRTFVFEYRLRGKPSQRYNIGRYGEPWTLDAARREAGRLRALVDTGVDPLARRAEQMGGGRTVSDLLGRFLEHTERLGRRAGTLKLYRQVCRAKIGPRLGRFHVSELTVERIEAFHAEMRATPIQANYTVGVLGRALNLAERWGWIARGSNPTRYVPRYPEPRRGEKKGDVVPRADRKALRRARGRGTHRAGPARDRRDPTRILDGLEDP